jgi:SAM-dependent methyltransferase
MQGRAMGDREEGLVWTIGRRLLSMGDPRPQEYRFAFGFLSDAKTILDVGCGTGTFCELAPERMVGIDINPDNVALCNSKGIKAQVGSALDLPWPDESFDGVHCSHLLQVFRPDEAVKCISELARVTKPGGTIVITTLNDFRRFYRHPENVRPYPPDALFRLFFAKPVGSSSPMWSGIPQVRELGIRRRRPPLVELEFPSSRALARVAGALNGLQLGLNLRKFWSFNAYTLALSKP